MEIGFIGTGTISAAVIEGLEAAAEAPRIVVSPRSEAVSTALAAKFPKVRRAASNAEVAEADIVYVLRMQHERMTQSFVPSLREYADRYQINDGRLTPSQLVMHPGPVNRGVELSGRTIDSPQVLIGDQVKAGVAVRMAVLYELLVGAPSLMAVAG